MPFRKDKGDGESAATAPPPTPADRVDEPKPADAPAPHGDPLAPAADPAPGGPQSPSANGPQSPSADAPPPNEATRVESPAPAEPAKVLAPDPVAQAAPPSAATRVDAPAPQPDQLVSAAPPQTAAAIACPQCGSPAERGQQMCIVCGSRIAPDPAEGTARDWKLPAALAGLGVLLIGVAIAFGVVELTSDDEVKKADVAELGADTQPAPAPAPAPATPTTPTEPTIPPATREPESPTPTPDDPASTTPDTAPDPSSSGPAEWPAGKTAYTVVLASATNRNAADAKAEQAVKRGIEAGVLRSDDFSSLRPGFWVVFAGQYDTSEEATRAADRYAEQGFGGGYPREVKPK